MDKTPTTNWSKGEREFAAERLAEKICLHHGLYHHKGDVHELVAVAIENAYKRGGEDAAAFIDGVQDAARI
jgi:hypothetical protein